MSKLVQEIEHANTIGITGHLRPDGDCVGSCLGLYQYIKDTYPNKMVQVYLQPFSQEFQILSGAKQVCHEFRPDQSFDLFIVLDCGALDRIPDFVEYYHSAKRTVCVDHHISNQGYGDVCVVDIDASSTAEAVYKLLPRECIGEETATALYLGIVHDTGVFKYSNTTKQTMRIAGDLIEKGAKPNQVIDETFYKKTYVQNLLLGKALLNSELLSEGKVIFSYLLREEFLALQATSLDVDGIIDQLRITDGVECAILLYATDENSYKVSMRSNSVVNVSEIALQFGGGGHVRAAGCTISDSSVEVIKEQLMKEINKQLMSSSKESRRDERV